MVYTFKTEGYISVNELLITLFLVITAPVVAHILAKVALHHRVNMIDKTQNKELVEIARKRRSLADTAPTKE
jgi:multicomponent K+:H+ antiporter subunit G